MSVQYFDYVFLIVSNGYNLVQTLLFGLTKGALEVVSKLPPILEVIQRHTISS